MPSPDRLQCCTLREPLAEEVFQLVQVIVSVSEPAKEFLCPVSPDRPRLLESLQGFMCRERLHLQPVLDLRPL